jgi:putative ABC transport system permease protein
VRLMAGQGLRLALAGAVIGGGLAAGLTRVIESLLFRTSATDWRTFVGVGCVFVIVALAASYVPARRAGRIDPMEALRVG